METLYMILRALMYFLLGYWTLSVMYAFFFIIPALMGKKEMSIFGKSGTDKANRFAVLIPAHNEGAVVGYLIDSLLKSDYPLENLKIFVIADNCTDGTASEARNKGAIALERFDDTLKGKPYAIGWALEKLKEMGVDYDAVVIFDADNLVSRNFFTEADMAMKRGAEAFQGSIECKNPGDSWVSAGDYLAYACYNRIYQTGRHNSGLGAHLNGTGMGFSKRVLDESGWSMTSLTEDREFTYKLLIDGVKVHWLEKATVYDEKPVGLQQAAKQQGRWASGAVMDIKKYVPPLWIALLKTKDIGFVDAIFRLTQHLFVGKAVAVPLLLIFFGSPKMWLWFAALIASSFAYLAVGLMMNRAPLKFYYYLVTHPFYKLIAVVAHLKSMLFGGDAAWSHTKHTRNIDIDDIAKK